MNIELNKKQLTHIILALEAYATILEQDEEDAGPSMADAMYVANLAKVFREKHEQAQ
jgi:hypothetical protein